MLNPDEEACRRGSELSLSAATSPMLSSSGPSTTSASSPRCFWQTASASKRCCRQKESGEAASASSSTGPVVCSMRKVTTGTGRRGPQRSLGSALRSFSGTLRALAHLGFAEHATPLLPSRTSSWPETWRLSVWRIPPWLGPQQAVRRSKTQGQLWGGNGSGLATRNTRSRWLTPTEFREASHGPLSKPRGKRTWSISGVPVYWDDPGDGNSSRFLWRRASSAGPDQDSRDPLWARGPG
jgi:hypothetical protein